MLFVSFVFLSENLIWMQFFFSRVWKSFNVHFTLEKFLPWHILSIFERLVKTITDILRFLSFYIHQAIMEVYSWNKAVSRQWMKTTAGNVWLILLLSFINNKNNYNNNNNNNNFKYINQSFKSICCLVTQRKKNKFGCFLPNIFLLIVTVVIFKRNQIWNSQMTGCIKHNLA